MVVLKDHFHVLIKPKIIDEYPKIIAIAKWNFSKNIDEKYVEPIRHYLSPSKIKRNEKGVWQRRYYEHTIRDEKSLYRHLDYIH